LELNTGKIHTELSKTARLPNKNASKKKTKRPNKPPMGRTGENADALRHKLE